MMMSAHRTRFESWAETGDCQRMRRALITMALLGCCLSTAGGQAPLTDLRQIAGLTPGQAAQKLPVDLQATVTYPRPSDKNLFVMEDGLGIYIKTNPDWSLLPGDLVHIVGVTSPSYRTTILASSVRFLAHGAMPKPRRVSYEDLIQARFDAQYVQIEGHVLAAAMDTSTVYQSLRMKVKVPNGIVEGIVANPGKLIPEALTDAEIRMTGISAGDFDSRMQLAGVWLYINSWADLEILHPPASNAWSLPVIPTDEAIFSLRNSNQSDRVHIDGTLTYFEPGSLAVVERQGTGMLVETKSELPLHAGDGVEVIGFPEVSDDQVHLASGELRPVPQSTASKPQKAGHFSYNLVSMEGNVLAEVHDSRVDLYILQANGRVFSATLRHSSSDAGADDTARSSHAIQVGTRVRVTGVCFVEPGNHWRDRLWFTVRMRSPADIALLEPPPFWTVTRLAWMMTLLVAISLGAAGWVGLLRRQVRQQTLIIAQKSEEEYARERRQAELEQQRSKILEQISSSEPLPKVLTAITATVSARLDDAPCWFDLDGLPEETWSEGGRLPNAGMETVSQTLSALDGTSLGRLLASPPAAIREDAETFAALRIGVRLAELAIDTRRLLSDLRHRSEHDLLTGIPNRFSMERHLEQILIHSIQAETSFGVIYIDLDLFKLINDRFGHRTGDLYLQAVTQRMKAQLRGADILARIGGDEFIALVPDLRSRAGAEEILVRIEHCFDTPFEIEDALIHGSASVGLAVYPDDGASMEELQRHADAAMYAHKQDKRSRHIFRDNSRALSL